MLDLSSWPLGFRRFGFWVRKARVRAASWRRASTRACLLLSSCSCAPSLSCARCRVRILSAALSRRSARWRNSSCVPAALLAGVAGQLDAVGGEHLAADQALGVTGHQHLREQRLDLIAQRHHKLGNVRVAGLAVATDGDELHVARAGGRDTAAGDQALAVGEQDDLEHHAWVIGTGARDVVLEARIQVAQIQLVIDEVVQRKGKTARHDLLRQHHGQHQRMAITGLVARHCGLLNGSVYLTRQGCAMNRG